MSSKQALIPANAIEGRIVILRGHRVILSLDLARLYGVEPRALAQAVKRNRERFPEDFMFQLTWNELNTLRSQRGIVTTGGPPDSKSQSVIMKRGQNIKYLPYAFTEQGVAMLSSVLRSRRAILVNIEIMRAFVRLRQIVAAHRELAAKLAELQRRLDTHDEAIREIMTAIRDLMEPPHDDPPRERIGFRPGAARR